MLPPALPATTARIAYRYAPQAVTQVLRDLAQLPRLALFLDLDALERSGTVVIDRVMLLALDGLAKTGVDVVFAATTTRHRAMRVRRAMLQPSRLVGVDGDALAETRRVCSDAPVLAVTDNAQTLACLGECDRELAMDAGANAIRASLWYLLHERTRLQ